MAPSSQDRRLRARSITSSARRTNVHAMCVRVPWRREFLLTSRLQALAFGRREFVAHLAQPIAKAAYFRQIEVLGWRDEEVRMLLAHALIRRTNESTCREIAGDERPACKCKPV